jgi:Iap family predicted aminopeptidase
MSPTLDWLPVEYKFEVPMSLLEPVALLFINILIAGAGLMLFGDPHAAILVKLVGTMVLAILLTVIEAAAIGAGAAYLTARSKRRQLSRT